MLHCERTSVVALFVILCVVTTFGAVAQQQINISGVVRSADLLTPLRFVSVRCLEARKTAITDKTGRYILKIPLPNVSLDTIQVIYSLVGYWPDTIRVSLRDTVFDVTLRERAFIGNELVVVAEDPAVGIMRKVLARKARQQITLQRYTYMLYTKFVATVDTITASRSTGRGDTTVFSILESYSKGYVELPNSYYNEIIQRRQTANVPPQANFVTFGTNLNAYDDVVSILNEEIASPFNPEALDIYDLVLTSAREADTVRIELRPKPGSGRAFIGEIYINQRTASPLEVRLTPNKAVNLPFDAVLTYRQTFDDVHGFIIPEALSITSSLTANILYIVSPRLDIEINTLCYDYSFNEHIDPSVFDRRRVELSHQAHEFDSTYWRANSKLPLRPEEAVAYADIQNLIDNPDSLESNILDRYIGPVTRTIARLGRKPFSGFEDVFRYNRIHGVYLGMGVRFRPDTALEIESGAGYGLSDRKFYGNVRLTLFPDELQKWAFDMVGFQQLARRDDPHVVRTGLISATTLLFGQDYGDYYYTRGVEAGIGYGWGQLRFIRNDLWARPNGVRLFVRSEQQESALQHDVWSLFSPNGLVRPNPTIIDGTMRTIGFEWKLQYSQLRRISRSGMFLHIETSQPEVLPSDFSFTLLRWNGVARMRTLPLWTLDIASTFGWSWGAVPPQRFSSLETSLSGLVVGSVFRGMTVKEFYGDRYATLSVSHNFGEVIPGILRIPDIASFGIEFILFGGLGWTAFSEQSRTFMQTALPTTDLTADRVYYEVGVGINRVLLFFRLDVNARLSQRSVPQIRLNLSGATF